MKAKERKKEKKHNRLGSPTTDQTSIGVKKYVKKISQVKKSRL